MESVASVYQKCQLSARRILARSMNAEVRKLYALTSPKNVPLDSVINETVSKSNKLSEKQKSQIDRNHSKTLQQSKWNNFMSLNEQCVLVRHLIGVCSVKIITTWQTLQQRLPSNIFAFCRKLTRCFESNTVKS